MAPSYDNEPFALLFSDRRPEKLARLNDGITYEHEDHSLKYQFIAAPRTRKFGTDRDRIQRAFPSESGGEDRWCEGFAATSSLARGEPLRQLLRELPVNLAGTVAWVCPPGGGGSQDAFVSSMSGVVVLHLQRQAKAWRALAPWNKDLSLAVPGGDLSYSLSRLEDTDYTLIFGDVAGEASTVWLPRYDLNFSGGLLEHANLKGHGICREKNSCRPERVAYTLGDVGAYLIVCDLDAGLGVVVKGGTYSRQEQAFTTLASPTKITAPDCEITQFGCRSYYFYQHDAMVREEVAVGAAPAPTRQCRL